MTDKFISPEPLPTDYYKAWCYSEGDVYHGYKVPEGAIEIMRSFDPEDVKTVIALECPLGFF
jgi:hypothetical protein